jgi:hypothetical protein
MHRLIYKGLVYVVAEVEDYRGQHRAPMNREGTAPLWRLTDIYPDDVYSINAVRYYGDRTPCDPVSVRIVQAARDKPDMPVKIYRAVPIAEGVDAAINPGDWVTICRPYAVQHGRSWLYGTYKIVSMTVRARDLFTDGNSIHEWGYDPQ